MDGNLVRPAVLPPLTIGGVQVPEDLTIPLPVPVAVRNVLSAGELGRLKARRKAIFDRLADQPIELHLALEAADRQAAGSAVRKGS
ncbi:MAG TPA: hypothetical protein PK280_14045 [Planctomycetota bacterium]|nr:hypothetical protein [Planctomycetota bacterium]